VLDLETGKKFEIKADGNELKSLDPDIDLYSDNEDKRYFLIVQKGLRENLWLSLAGLKRD
jgi:hypothetical protein